MGTVLFVTFSPDEKSITGTVLYLIFKKKSGAGLSAPLYRLYSQVHMHHKPTLSHLRIIKLIMMPIMMLELDCLIIVVNLSIYFHQLHRL